MSIIGNKDKKVIEIFSIIQNAVGLGLGLDTRMINDIILNDSCRYIGLKAVIGLVVFINFFVNL